MIDIFDSFIEWGGRRRRLDPVNFPEDEVILPALELDVPALIEKTYINLPPAVYGAITAPDGQRTIIANGGVWELPAGIYKMDYIDQRERTRLLDKIEGTTSDGFQITLKVQFSYRVFNPASLLEVDNPVRTLLTTLETAIKNYIISHTHDEIVKPAETDDSLDERAFERYVLRLLTQTPTCSGFTISNLFIQEWIGDPKYLALRKAGQFLEKESRNKQKQLQLEQNVVVDEKELERKKGEVQQTKAEAELKVQEALVRVQQLKIELERVRSLPERRHKEIMNMIEAIKEMPGFPRNASDSKLLQDLTNTLLEKTETASHVPTGRNGRSGSPDQEQKVSDLAQTIMRLVQRK